MEIFLNSNPDVKEKGFIMKCAMMTAAALSLLGVVLTGAEPYRGEL